MRVRVRGEGHLLAVHPVRGEGRVRVRGEG